MNLFEFMKEIEYHHIIGVVGNLGDGKTISGVSILAFYTELNKRLGNNRSILTNVPLTIEHEFLQFFEQLEDREDTTLFLDEIHLSADSREWHKKSNYFTTNITMDVRKLKNKFIYTSQYANQVEKRVRQLTTLWIKPRCIHGLIFDLILADTYLNSDYEHITLNLDPLKNIYDTHYRPQRLLNEGDDE